VTAAAFESAVQVIPSPHCDVALQVANIPPVVSPLVASASAASGASLAAASLLGGAGAVAASIAGGGVIGWWRGTPASIGAGIDAGALAASCCAGNGGGGAPVVLGAVAVAFAKSPRPLPPSIAAACAGGAHASPLAMPHFVAKCSGLVSN
jgi:hypothetical protein